jgi:hypothetical protein
MLATMIASLCTTARAQCSSSYGVVVNIANGSRIVCVTPVSGSYDYDISIEVSGVQPTLTIRIPANERPRTINIRSL